MLENLSRSQNSFPAADSPDKNADDIFHFFLRNAVLLRPDPRHVTAC